MPFSCLPQDLITLIFLLLPFEQLVKLRCVNKFCFQFICSPNFVKAHLKKSVEYDDLSRYCLLSIREECLLERVPILRLLHRTDTVQYPILRRLDEALIKPAILNFGLDRLVGSCNGLICIVIKETDCRLWNPFIGKQVLIPRPGLHAQSQKECLCTRYGFGYDESNDDYKVVVAYLFSEDNLYYSMVKVFSLKRNSWKRISNFTGGLLEGDSSKLAGGMIHWLVHPSHNRSSQKIIVSFDLKNEVFGIVEQPNYGTRSFVMTLGILGGCICVFCDDKEKHDADLWIMKEHGIKMSWTKLVTFSFTHQHYRRYWNRYWRPWEPCLMLQDGEILFYNADSFGVYNPKDNSFECIFLNNYEDNEPDGNFVLQELFTRSDFMVEYPELLKNRDPQNKVLSMIHVGSLVSPVCTTFTRKGGRKSSTPNIHVVDLVPPVSMDCKRYYKNRTNVKKCIASSRKQCRKDKMVLTKKKNV